MSAVFCRICPFFVVVFVMSVNAYSANFPTGYATYSELSEVLFMTSLFNESGKFEDPSKERRLEFKILANKLSARRFNQLLARNAAINNAPENLARNKLFFEQLLGFLKSSLYRGDHLVYFSDGVKVNVTLNTIEIGEIESAELFDILLNIWVGDVPPSRDFKDELTGRNDSQGLADNFRSISFDSSRIPEIKSWLVPDEPQNIEVPVEEPEESVQTAANEELQAELTKALKEVKKQQREIELARIAEEEEKRKETERQEKIKQRQDYMLVLTRHARKNIAYPRRSLKFNQTGNVIASVTIGRDGQLLEFLFEEKAQHDLLNKAVKSGVDKALPFPNMPDEIEGDSITFRVPVAFSTGG